jgi:hypothetical protein
MSKKEDPVIGRIIDIQVKEIDKSFVPNVNNMTLEERIEYVKSLFTFDEDKTLMNQMIEELKNQNKDDE